MTNRDIVSRVRSSFKWNSSDVLITDRAILAECQSTASKYIKQQLDKRKLWNSTNIFTPLRVEMIPVPIIETCDYTGECTISRSKYPLPKIAEGQFGLATTGAYSVGLKAKFFETTPQRYINLLKLNLSNKNIYYWIFNNYLYSSSSTLKELIFPAYVEGDVPAYFNMDCSVQNGCPINPLDMEFKCPSYLEEDIVRAVSEFYLSTYKRSVADNTSNSLEDIK